MFWRKPRPPRPTTVARIEQISGPTMGTRYGARFVAPAGLDRGALQVRLQAAVDGVDNQMSTWKPDSVLMAFNAAPLDAFVPVPADMAFVTALGLEVAALSGGAFDPTLGALVEIWGFGASGPRRDAPPQDLVQALLQASGPSGLSISPSGDALTKSRDLKLDFSGIAKGFGVDRLAEIMLASGTEHFVVDIDGELRASGNRPDGSDWRIAVELPVSGQRLTHSVLRPGTSAVATSGDYRRFIEIGGERLAHTIDPRTGAPLRNALGSVTVMADTCARADALATAILVLGEDEGFAFAEAHNLDALLLVRTDFDFAVRTTGNFAARLDLA